MAFELDFQRFPAPEGPIRYARIPWDTELIGFPFYQLDVGNAEAPEFDARLGEWLASLAERPCMVVAKVGTEDVRRCSVLAGHGFYPVETMIDVYVPLARINTVFEKVPAHLRLRDAAEGDLPAIRDIAAAAFTADRFHVDPHIPNERAGRRYAFWVDNAFQSGDTLLAYEDARRGEIVGFCHLRAVGTDIVDLTLPAIVPRLQDIGLGPLMYQEVLKRCREQGYRAAEGRISINNINVMNLMGKLGFSFRNPTVTLHCHIRAENG